MDKIYHIKSRDKLGIVQFPSKAIDIFGHMGLNNVLLEDGTIVMVPDSDLEEINDRPKEIEE